MMLNPIDNYLLHETEPIKSCLQFLRAFILNLDNHITEKWQYGMPFFYYKNKRICYCWVDKKRRIPYLGIVDGHKIDHPDLLKEKRARMKILLIDPGKNIPVAKLKTILKQAISFYK